MNFCMMGDSTFYSILRVNITAIKKYYPNSLIYIGDMGFSEKEISNFKQWGCRIIDMPDLESHDISFILMCKPLFINKIPSHFGDVLCFMDADAVLINPFPTDFLAGYNIGVTTRVSDDGPVNAGVVFLRGDRSDFISDWTRRAIHLMRVKEGKLNEQDALAELALYSNHYNVKHLPCGQYNCPRIEDGLDENIYVIHLKSRRRFKGQYINQLKEYVANRDLQ